MGVRPPSLALSESAVASPPSFALARPSLGGGGVSSLSAGCMGVTTPSRLLHLLYLRTRLCNAQGAQSDIPLREPCSSFPIYGLPARSIRPPPTPQPEPPPKKTLTSDPPPLKLMKAVRMHLSRCHESDQILKGCRGRSMEPPDLGTALILGVQSEGLGGDRPLLGLCNYTAPTYTAGLIPAVSLAPSPDPLDLQWEWDGEHSPKEGGRQGEPLSLHQPLQAPVEP